MMRTGDENVELAITGPEGASMRCRLRLLAALSGLALLAAALAALGVASARAQKRQSARPTLAAYAPSRGLALSLGRGHLAGVVFTARRGVRATHSAWGFVPVAGGSAFESLDAVSCASASFCLAVGEAYQGEGEKPYVASWNGVSWTSGRAPMPEGTTSAELDAVSCDTSSYCVAVGSAKTTSGVFEPLIEEWASGGLHLSRAPEEERAMPEAGLRGVACISQSFCMAVGAETSELDAGATTAALAYGWDGSQWSRLPSSAAGGGDTRLASVSCSAPDACTAIGATGTAAYIGRWNGSRWESQRPPAPTGEFAGHETFLSGVSCPLEALCVAVGGVLLGGADGSFASLQGTWRGSRWTTAARVELGPESVSCVATSCVAVGNTGEGGAGPYHEPTAERLVGGHWILIHPIRPSRPSGFLGVSCYAAGKCFAVGWRVSSGHQVALVERY